MRYRTDDADEARAPSAVHVDLTALGPETCR
ncbi:hypothetical protein F4554_005532 [Actinopolymorpha rutila]|uniref:Uncharacterized protein n=1 Tax=Actinopolymorpha rutila TaxID=446787 RepID=A0A852ZIW3_9ACTN|nr:hypothetical protein [Actinopolymorpha rutila]